MPLSRIRKAGNPRIPPSAPGEAAMIAATLPGNGEGTPSCGRVACNAAAVVGLIAKLTVRCMQQLVNNIQLKAEELSRRYKTLQLQYIDAQTNNEELVARAQLQESIYVFRDSHLALLGGGEAPGFKSQPSVTVIPITSSEINNLLFSIISIFLF